MPQTDASQMIEDTSLDGQTWVIIETGSNQTFILTSNRRRYAVGASHLVKRLAIWVDEAVDANREATRITKVVVTSSKALLLVPERSIGLDLVRAVTERALVEAPGLDVWGYVEEPPPGLNMTMQARLSALHSAHADQRWRRAQPVARAPMAPFLDACAFTGRAAVRRRRRADDLVAVSSQADMVLSASQHARRSMQDQLVEPPPPPRGLDVPEDDTSDALGDQIRASVAESDDGDGLLNAGWIAVVHADGNRVGDVVSTIGSVDDLTTFSAALSWATARALRSAVAEVVGQSKDEEGNAPKQWLLPLVVGGDDVTLVCDARYAVTLTRAYLRHFERYTSFIPTTPASKGIAGWINDALKRPYLTASAGIAVVKPKFPFSSAYQLAEMLAREAKRGVKDSNHGAQDRSSYDLHILRDSVLSDLENMRPKSGSALLSLVATPLLAPSGVEAVGPSSVWVKAHEDQAVIDQVESIARQGSKLSGSEIRRLRTSMTQGLPAMEAVRERFAARAIDAGDDPYLLSEEGPGGNRLTRWPVVLDLIDIRTGTVVGRSKSK